MNDSWLHDGHDRRREEELEDRAVESREETLELDALDKIARSGVGPEEE